MPLSTPLPISCAWWRFAHHLLKATRRLADFPNDLDGTRTSLEGALGAAAKFSQDLEISAVVSYYCMLLAAIWSRSHIKPATL